MTDVPIQIRWYHWSQSGSGMIQSTPDPRTAPLEFAFYPDDRVQVHGKQSPHENYMGYTLSAELEKLMNHLRVLSIPYKREDKKRKDRNAPPDLHCWSRHHSVWITKEGFNALESSNNVMSVDRVIPTTAQLNQVTTFTVIGKNLPSTLALSIEDGHDVTRLQGSTSTQVQFTCKPRWSQGKKRGVVKTTYSEPAIELFRFELVVG